jgi:AAA+ superfamily predicted ATPase
MRGRLGPMAKGMRWPSLADATQGLSHADLVKAAEAAAKQALMRDDERVTAPDLVFALDARRTTSSA